MNVAREIAQAKSYSQAYSVLSYQIAAASIAFGVYGPHWGWGFVAFVTLVVLSTFKWTSFLILVVFSSFWAFVAHKIGTELDSGIWSYAIGLIAFLISYGVNLTGMVGLEHSVPNLTR